MRQLLSDILHEYIAGIVTLFTQPDFKEMYLCGERSKTAEC